MDMMDKKKAKRHQREERRRQALGGGQDHEGQEVPRTHPEGPREAMAAVSKKRSDGGEQSGGGKKKKSKTTGGAPRAADGRPEGEGAPSKIGERKGAFLATARGALAAQGNSRVAAERLFAMLIAPITIEEFYRDYFEKKPLLVKRQNPSYYDEFMTMEHVSTLLEASLEWSYEVL